MGPVRLSPALAQVRDAKVDDGLVEQHARVLEEVAARARDVRSAIGLVAAARARARADAEKETRG